MPSTTNVGARTVNEAFSRQLPLSLNRPLLAASGASGEPWLILADLRRYNF
ncbi:MAG TPA: hypothetical protein VF740_14940 [Candidatus Acidoferrum sp.]